MDTGTTFRRFLRLALVPFIAALVAVLVGTWIGVRFVAQGPQEGVLFAARDGEEEFDRRVRDYLLRNPDVLVEAMQTLEAGPARNETDDLAIVLRDRTEEINNDPASPAGGNPKGDVSLVEFFDYNCPYCRRMGPVLKQMIANDSNLRIVYKEWPILGSGSTFAAKAALAAHKQGKYVAFHQALMAGPGQANESRVLEVAEKLGLDVERLRRDMEADDIAGAVDRNMALARALRITGTPTFIVGSEIIRGAVDLATLESSVVSARSTEPTP
ncbi:MAG: DsbA family protein [Alphaproteobacteria bacterium]